MWVIPEAELVLIKSVNVTDESGVTRPLFNVTVKPDVDTQDEMLSFAWKPIKMTKRTLEAELNFNNPSWVSMAYRPDVLEV